MSSVAETIMFIFQADALKLNKGLAEAAKLDKDLEKGLVGTDQVAQSLGSTLINLAKTAGSSLGGLLAANAVLDLATGAAEATNEIRRLAERNNMAVETYSALRSAVQATGADLGEFQTGLEAFAEKVEDPEQKLRDLAAQMESLSHFQALQLGQELGLSPSLIAILEQGTESFNNLLEVQKELGSVTAEQAETARRFQMQQASSNLVWDSIRRSIGLALLPTLTALLEKFQALGIWVRENQQTVVLFFAGLAAVITVAYLPAIITATAATFAFLAPWLGVAALFATVAAVFALLINDALAFLNGQDSLIGELSKKWPIIGNNVKAIAATLKSLYDLAGAILQFFVTAFTDGIDAALSGFGAKVSSIFDEFVAQFPALQGIVDVVDQAFAELGNITGLRLDDVTAIISTWFDVVKAMFGLISDIIAVGPEQAFENLKVKFGAIIDDIKAQFPGVGEAIEDVGETIDSVVDGAVLAWESLISIIERAAGVIGSVIGAVKSGANYVGELFGSVDEEQGSQQSAIQGPSGYAPGLPDGTQAQLEQGAGVVQQSAREPLASMTSNAITNNNAAAPRSYSQSIGQVNVHTQATDGQGVVDAVANDLGGQMKSAIEQFDDGVLA